MTGYSYVPVLLYGTLVDYARAVTSVVLTCDWAGQLYTDPEGREVWGEGKFWPKKVDGPCPEGCSIQGAHRHMYGLMEITAPKEATVETHMNRNIHISVSSVWRSATNSVEFNLSGRDQIAHEPTYTC